MTNSKWVETERASRPISINCWYQSNDFVLRFYLSYGRLVSDLVSCLRMVLALFSIAFYIIFIIQCNLALIFNIPKMERKEKNTPNSFLSAYCISHVVLNLHFSITIIFPSRVWVFFSTSLAQWFFHYQRKQYDKRKNKTIGITN